MEYGNHPFRYAFPPCIEMRYHRELSEHKTRTPEQGIEAHIALERAHQVAIPGQHAGEAAHCE
jgi:hypothetical protein